jgi:uncharacterized membrane protein YqjE
VTARQVLIAALVLAVVSASMVWALERFNRDLLIRQFREELAKLPTAIRPDAGTS